MLLRNASSLDRLESEMANAALFALGRTVSAVSLTPHVSKWSVTDVLCWLRNTDCHPDIIGKFEKHQVDGDVLLQLDETVLKGGLQITNAIAIMRLSRLLKRLKVEADYSLIDPTNLADWLRQISLQQPVGRAHSVSPSDWRSGSLNRNAATVCPFQKRLIWMTPSANLSQYTYNFVSAGVDRSVLPRLTDSLLQHTCRIENAFHRLCILTSALNSEVGLELNSECPLPPNRPLDVFISYRRSTGSELASLVGTFLKIRGYDVFLDVNRLSAGRFDESLLHSISNANNVVVILSANCLDRCINDEDCNDWVHREIAWALKCDCVVIPVKTPSFVLPLGESLPSDMSQLLLINMIEWSHQYQEGSVDKIEYFMKKRPRRPQSLNRNFSQFGSSDYTNWTSVVGGN